MDALLRKRDAAQPRGFAVLHQPFELYGQFLLSSSMASVASPAGWKLSTAHGWSLRAHPTLPVVKLHAAIEAGRLLDAGWIIGWPIVAERLVRDQLVLPDDTVARPERFELWLAGVSGRFLIVTFSAASLGRIYPDPAASLSLVYAVDERWAASTPTALSVGRGNGERYRRTMSTVPRLQPNQFLPAGLTSDENVFRLLPNHFLDLDRWEMRRHWPSGLGRRVSEPEAPALAELVATRTQSTIQAFADAHLLSSGLTAGRDSRMVLACAKKVIDRVELFTFDYKDPSRSVDVHIARKLAKRFRLHHRVLDVVDPTPELEAAYLYRVGYCSNPGKVRDFYDACRRLLDMSRVLLTGFGGEVGRGFYWKPGDHGKPARALQTADLLARMRLPQSAGALEAMERWRAGTPPGIDACSLLDLMYQELRLGCWASPQLYGAAPFAAIIMPLSHRESFAAMLALPAQYRMQQKLADDVISAAWPELLEVPFQTYTGWRQGVRRTRQRLRQFRARYGG